MSCQSSHSAASYFSQLDRRRCEDPMFLFTVEALFSPPHLPIRAEHLSALAAFFSDILLQTSTRLGSRLRRRTSANSCARPPTHPYTHKHSRDHCASTHVARVPPPRPRRLGHHQQQQQQQQQPSPQPSQQPPQLAAAVGRCPCFRSRYCVRCTRRVVAVVVVVVVRSN